MEKTKTLKQLSAQWNRLRPYCQSHDKWEWLCTITARYMWAMVEHIGIKKSDTERGKNTPVPVSVYTNNNVNDNLPPGYDWLLCMKSQCPRCAECVRYLLYKRAQQENYNNPNMYFHIQETDHDKCPVFWKYKIRQQ